MENFYQKNHKQKELSVIHETWRELTGLDMIAPGFQNGTRIDMKILEPLRRDITIGIKNDFENFFTMQKGAEAEKEGIWQGVSIIETILELQQKRSSKH